MEKQLKLKGPKGLPIIGNLHQIKLDKLHLHFEHWAKEHGEVYEIHLGPTKMVVVTKPSIIQQICKARPDDFIRMKKMDNVLRDNGVVGVFNTEHEEWKIHRKVVAKGLDVKHQQFFFPSILKVVDKFHKKLNSIAENKIEYGIQDDLLRFTVDVTFTLVFGHEMNTLEQKGGVIQEHMEKLFPMVFKRINSPIQWHKIYKTKKDKEFDVAVNEVNKLISEFIQIGRERLEKHPERKIDPENLLEAIIVAAEEEHIFSDEEIKGNLLTLLMAGEDTTAHSLAWALYLLSQYPAYQERLAQEADDVLKENQFLKNYDDLSELTFTEAVINESMRLKPVAPILLFQATRDIEIDQILFKKNTNIAVNSRYAATSDEYFTESKHFNPDRWLRKTNHGCPMHQTSAFLPFGAGPRLCPGKNLAILEMKLILSMIFKNFKVELVSNFDDVQEIMAFTMMASDFKIKLVKR